MLLRKLVVVGLVGFVSFAANIATAQDADAPAAVTGVSFVDPDTEFEADRFSFDLRLGSGPRFESLAPGVDSAPFSPDFRRYEVAVVARTVRDIDVAIAQRGGFGFNADGDIARESRAAELRLGRGLGMRREDNSGAPRWYMFAASEDEALTWAPGARTDFGGSGAAFALQDQVEIGDIQAGVTYEAYGLQASLAYVEREVSVRSGSRTFSHDENFAGFTLTMRR